MTFITNASRRDLLRHCSRIAAAVLMLPAMAGVNTGRAQGTSTASGASGASAGSTAPGASSASGKARRERVVLVVGDSLSAEYGITRGSGWVALLEARIKERGLAARVVNASISGDTTAGGRARLSALLAQHQPSHVILELGANDALRGLPLANTQENLLAMVRSAKEVGARVLLVGMQVPPNYGRSYTEAFAQVFATVARSESVDLVPFLLKDVADGPNPQDLFQADRIHPKEQAQPRMLDNVWTVLRKQLGA